MDSQYRNKMNALIDLIHNAPQEDPQAREIANYARELRAENLSLQLDAAKERDNVDVLMKALSMALRRLYHND